MDVGRPRRHGDRDAGAPRAGRPALAHRRPRCRRDPRGARAAPRAGADARLPAAHRPLRRRVRRGPGGPHSRRAWRRAPTASTSARSSRASPRSCARRPGNVELAPGAIVADVPRLREALGASERPHGAGGPPPAALQQLVDAQPRAAGEGQGPLHGARAPRRRRAAGPDRRRPRAAALGGRRGRGARGGDRLGDAGRGERSRTAGATTPRRADAAWPPRTPG